MHEACGRLWCGRLLSASLEHVSILMRSKESERCSQISFLISNIRIISHYWGWISSYREILPPMAANRLPRRFIMLTQYYNTRLNPGLGTSLRSCCHTPWNTVRHKLQTVALSQNRTEMVELEMDLNMIEIAHIGSCILYVLYNAVISGFFYPSLVCNKCNKKTLGTLYL